jgi:quercetin dioxygenase-like cupin family protein
VSEPVVVPPRRGEIVGDSAGRRVEILSDDGSLHATWSRFSPRRDGADLHVHRLHTDLFYVLEGELTVRLGLEDEGVVVPAGTLARVPRFVVHGFRNGSDADVRYLNFHAPGMEFADYLRAVRDGRPFSYDQYPPPADGGRATADAVVGGDAFGAGAPGVRERLLADVEEIAVAEVRSGPGGVAPTLHLHRRHVESLYVLEGELTVVSETGELRAGEGTWVQMPAGVPHALGPPPDGAVRFLVAHTPGCGFGAFVRGLAEARGDEDEAAARAGFDQAPASRGAS